jgi:hypothetical protein
MACFSSLVTASTSLTTKYPMRYFISSGGAVQLVETEVDVPPPADALGVKTGSTNKQQG